MKYSPMKRIFLILILGLFGCASQKFEPVVSLLKHNVGTWRDEIFHFRVTYSDVELGTNGFNFTQTMLLQESEGSYKITSKCSLSLKSLKSSDHEVLINEGIGKNTLVRIKLSKDLPSPTMSASLETIDSEGKKVVKTASTEELATATEIIDGKEYYVFDICFPDEESATDWNDSLSKCLK